MGRCAICQCDMPAAEFSKADADGDDTTFRLTCGHAFHAVCLCASLLTGPSCPVCRDGSPEHSGATLVINGDGTMELDFSEYSDDEDVPAAQHVHDLGALLDKLHEARRRPEVQRARAAAQQARRHYRQVEATVVTGRAAAIRSALDAFRQEHRPRFELARRRLRAALRSVQRLETDAVRSLMPGVDTDLLRQEYDLQTWVGVPFGPLKHGFWAR